MPLITSGPGLRAVVQLRGTSEDWVQQISVVYRVLYEGLFRKLLQGLDSVQGNRDVEVYCLEFANVNGEKELGAAGT